MSVGASYCSTNL